MSAISSISSLIPGNILQPFIGKKHGSGSKPSSTPSMPQLGGAGLKQLQNSVLMALQSAQSADPSADPNQTIESAIAAIFKNGLNATSATSASAANADTSETDPASASQTFFKAISQYGITPEDFQSDFAAAVKDVQNSIFAGKTAQQFLSKGSLLDMLA